MDICPLPQMQVPENRHEFGKNENSGSNPYEAADFNMTLTNQNSLHFSLPQNLVCGFFSEPEFVLHNFSSPPLFDADLISNQVQHYPSWESECCYFPCPSVVEERSSQTLPSPFPSYPAFGVSASSREEERSSQKANRDFSCPDF